jgi:hypothetical protein
MPKWSVIKEFCKTHGVEAFKCTHWAEGGKGTEELAKHVAALAEKDAAHFKPIYDDSLSLWDKVKTIAREIYRADDIVATRRSATSSRAGKRRATASSRSAWPRRSIPSRPTRTSRARPRTTWCRSARSASRRAPNSSLSSAVRS